MQTVTVRCVGRDYRCLKRWSRLFHFCRVICITALLCAWVPLKTALALFIGAAAHESGHLIMLRLCGVRYGGISLRIGGAVMRGEFSCAPYWTEMLCAAAGPFFNLLLMAIGKTSGFADLAAANFLLAAYNLLPLPGHDGQNILRALCTQMAFGEEAERWLGILSLFCAALLFMFSAWIFWYGACVRGAGGFASGGLFLCLGVRVFSAISEYARTDVLAEFPPTIGRKMR